MPFFLLIRHSFERVVGDASKGETSVGRTVALLKATVVTALLRN